MEVYFLDTETTGLHPPEDRIVEIAIIDRLSNVIFNSLIDPNCSIPSKATEVHGITDADIYGYPTFEDVELELYKIIKNNHIIIYNAAFDRRFFPDNLSSAARISCAMRAYASRKHPYRWHKLSDAANDVGHIWSGPQHRALGDALACKSVWEFLHGAEFSRNIGNAQRKLPNPENYEENINTYNDHSIPNVTELDIFANAHLQYINSDRNFPEQDLEIENHHSILRSIRI